MGQISEKAFLLFKTGYNCGQSVLCAFEKEIGLDFETLAKIGSSLGGGMGRLREVCGAVSGMFVAAGMIYGYTNPEDLLAKAKHYKLIQELAQKFKDKNRYIVCRDLLGTGKEFQSPIPEARTEEYYKKRPCAELVRCAAAILEEYIRNGNKENI
jgi:C_GCAxxG_C_C family probable redox protein